MSQAEGKTLNRLSYETGISVETLQHYCQKGRIIGAQKHPLTKRWIVFPPCKLVTSTGDHRAWKAGNSGGSGKYAG